MIPETGEHGVHAVKLTATYGENPWWVWALVDFGPEHHLTAPRVVSVMDEEQLRQLHGEMNELLGET